MIFSFLQGKICAPEKSGASQRFCTPERAQSASGAQFVQACCKLQQWLWTKEQKIVFVEAYFHFISFELKYITRRQVKTWLPKISKYG